MLAVFHMLTHTGWLVGQEIREHTQSVVIDHTHTYDMYMYMIHVRTYVYTSFIILSQRDTTCLVDIKVMHNYYYCYVYVQYCSDARYVRTCTGTV